MAAFLGQHAVRRAALALTLLMTPVSVSAQPAPPTNAGAGAAAAFTAAESLEGNYLAAYIAVAARDTAAAASYSREAL